MACNRRALRQPIYCRGLFSEVGCQKEPRAHSEGRQQFLATLWVLIRNLIPVVLLPAHLALHRVASGRHLCSSGHWMSLKKSPWKCPWDVEGVVRRQGDERLHPGARASGGTGRRAWLRAMSPQGGGGSSPSSPTKKIPHHRAFHAARRPIRRCPASAALFNDDGGLVRPSSCGRSELEDHLADRPVLHCLVSLGDLIEPVANNR
jgi:hypothetical protein